MSTFFSNTGELLMNKLNHQPIWQPKRGLIPAFTLVGLLSVACGSRKDEDDATRKAKEGNSGNGASLIVAGNQPTNADSVAVGSSCEVELKQSSTFDPAQTQTQVLVAFRGKVAAECLSSGKEAEVLLFSKGKLTVPGATCTPENGSEFNIKCAGDIVKSDGSGSLEIAFDGKDNLEQLKTLRVKVRYVAPTAKQ
jgi:hypothetical protein